MRGRANSIADTDAYSYATTGNAYANRNTIDNAFAVAYAQRASTISHTQSDAAAAPDTVPAPHAVTDKPTVPFIAIGDRLCSRYR